jgi:DNA polymerase III alpha subunit (gram-positive type)
MQSPYKKVIVYDLETGGLDYKVNSITEIAMVVIDLETLKVEDTFTTMIKPNFDLEFRHGDSLKEARAIFKLVSSKDEETKIPHLRYKGKTLTIKDLDSLSNDISLFDEKLNIVGTTFDYNQILKMEASDKFGDIAKMYFDKTYNPQALNVTHMTREMMVEQGVELNDAIEQCVAFIKKYTIGNAKPILAGHNIKKFDNPFLDKMLSKNGYDMSKLFSETQMIDTLEWARLRWFDAPSFALGVCANAVGVRIKDAHRALPDTEANAEFLIKMLN